LPKVPPGCERSLAGTYRHQDDETFRYDVTDDGSAVHIRAYHQFGATRQAIASSAADIDLRRTPEGLRGSAETTAPTLSGARTCTVTFPYEVTACSPTALTLRTVLRFQLTEACEPEDPLHLDFASNVLVRVAESDAGESADAGPGDAGAAELDAGDAIDAGAATGEAGPSDAGAELDAESPAGDAGP
jgi:hypothetical protein